MAAKREQQADRRELVDVAEDLLDEIAALRKDVRPIMSLGWILLGLIAVMLLLALLTIVVAALA